MSPDEINVRVGAAIRNHRTRLGLSQDKVAKSLGITFQQVQKYEKGSNQLTIARAMQLSNALGWTLIELLTVALDEPASLPAAVSDRATLEFAKRFSQLKPNERKGVTLLLNNLVEAA